MINTRKNLKDEWNLVKRSNVHVIKVSEVEERQNGEKAIFEEVFPNQRRHKATDTMKAYILADIQ